MHVQLKSSNRKHPLLECVVQVGSKHERQQVEFFDRQPGIALLRYFIEPGARGLDLAVELQVV